jgi:hypothetical protein
VEQLQHHLERPLSAGEVGVIMARAGVGKTAFLVQVGLTEALAGREIIHIALGQNLGQVQAGYEALFTESIPSVQRKAWRRDLTQRRAIQAFSERRLSAGMFENAIKTFSHHLNINPALILIDGLDWNAADPLLFSSLRAEARRVGACLWISAQTHREEAGSHPTAVPAPVCRFMESVELAVYLEPLENKIQARVLFSYGQKVADLHLTLRPFDENNGKGFCLLSGAAEGAEEFFGQCAERFGLVERNFSFAGRKTVRTRGLVSLSDDDLKQGDISFPYLKRKMNRSYPETTEFKKVLQTIWHQVNPAGEVFAVGLIQSDNTVKGGTGWAVELAKHLNKRVHVFDQNEDAWFQWQKGCWNPVRDPSIQCKQFTGTGSRSLKQNGRLAIASLFERSFSS